MRLLVTAGCGLRLASRAAVALGSPPGSRPLALTRTVL